MNIDIKNIPEEGIDTDALVLPIFEDYKTDMYKDLDEKIGGFIDRLFQSGEFTGKEGHTALVHLQGFPPKRLCMVGLGKGSDITAEKLRQAAGKAFKRLRSIACSRIAISSRLFNELMDLLNGDYIPIYYFLEGGLLSLYRFMKYKRKLDEGEDHKEITEITVLGEDTGLSLDWLKVTVDAVNYARDLVNTPANDMTPAALSHAALGLAGGNVEVRILDRKEAQKEGMNSYLSVSKGSDQPPKFIILRYDGASGSPLAIVGKAVTFDSGGLSLKPAEAMEHMKHDMGGAAATLGVIKAAAALELPVHLVAILPATENMTGGSASKPGDMVTSISGKTIEILNTDAEGRLTLADGIGYAIKYYKPSAVIDIATLTGACGIALGNEAIAMMGTDTGLMDKIGKAAQETFERVWPMPLFEEYKEYIKSDFADLKNIGGRVGGLVTAAYFLKEFTGDTPWVHLDIASTVWNTKEKPYRSKGATGIGVRLLLNLIKSL